MSGVVCFLSRKSNAAMTPQEKLVKEIDQAPNDLVEEVLDFLLFAKARRFSTEGLEDYSLNYAAAKLAEPSFAKVWDNLEDADYDNL
jgi:hypothetical protein